MRLSLSNNRADWNIVLNNHCLLVIDNDSPLKFALEMLLVPSSGIQAVKSNARDLQGIVDEVCELKSQAVILEDSATPAEENLWVLGGLCG